FEAGSYSIAGEAMSFATAVGFERSTATYARNLAGVVSSFAIDTPALTDKGLLIQPAITRLNAAPANLHGWTAAAAGTEVELAAEGVFTNPVTVGTSTGNAGSSRQDAVFSVTDGDVVRVRARY